MNRLLLAALAAAALASGCVPGRARVLAASPLPGLEVSLDEAFYHVGGLTLWDLNRDLFRRGPRLAGVRWQGLTDFRLVYSYQPAAAAGGCRAVEPKVSVQLVTTLPQWKDRAVAPETLRTDWDVFLTRLRAHEAGHQQIAIGAGRQLLRDVARLRAPDCDMLHRSAVAVARSYQASVTRDQRGWDDLTRSGLDGRY